MPIDYWQFHARGRRKEMEDKHVIHQCETSKWCVYAVLDGHGGVTTATNLSTLLTAAVLPGIIDQVPYDPHYGCFDRVRLVHVIKKLLLQCDQQLMAQSVFADRNKTVHTDESGSTLVCMFYHPETRQCVVANVGDSHGWLRSSTSANKSGVIFSTVMHKPNDTKETERVERAGLKVRNGRVGGILAVSRAFGDKALKQSARHKYDSKNGAVCAMPDLHYYRVAPAEKVLVVLACDGIWDVMDDAESYAIVSEAMLEGKTDPAYALVTRAFDKGSSDNLSAIVVHIYPSKEDEAAEAEEAETTAYLIQDVARAAACAAAAATRIAVHDAGIALEDIDFAPFAA